MSYQKDMGFKRVMMLNAACQNLIVVLMVIIINVVIVIGVGKNNGGRLRGNVPIR